VVQKNTLGGGWQMTRLIGAGDFMVQKKAATPLDAK